MKRALLALGVVAFGFLGASVPATALESSGEAALVEPDFKTPINAGDHTTPFSLNLPFGAACPQDSTTGDFRVQSFVVPSTIDPGSLKYESIFPISARGQEISLWDVTENPMINYFTDLADEKGGEGRVINIPLFDFKVPELRALPAGRYKVGLACALFGATKRYWSTDIQLLADGPVRWRAVTPVKAESNSNGQFLLFGGFGIALVGGAYWAVRDRSSTKSDSDDKQLVDA